MAIIFVHLNVMLTEFELTRTKNLSIELICFTKVNFALNGENPLSAHNPVQNSKNTILSHSDMSGI